MAGGLRGPIRRPPWENRLTGRQRGALVLVLSGVIAVAGGSAWRQWRAAFSTNSADAAWALGDGGKRDFGLPIPDGAHVVLPPGAIPAIKAPVFVPVASAQARPESPMILVSRDGETHVYSIYLLDGHEIVNDVLGGEPIATTW